MTLKTLCVETGIARPKAFGGITSAQVMPLSGGQQEKVSTETVVPFGRRSTLSQTAVLARRRMAPFSVEATAAWPAWFAQSVNAEVAAAWNHYRPITGEDTAAWADTPRRRPWERPPPPECYLPPAPEGDTKTWVSGYEPPEIGSRVTRDWRVGTPMPPGRSMDTSAGVAWRQGDPVTSSDTLAWRDVLRARPWVRPPVGECYTAPAIPILRTRASGYSPPGTALNIFRDRREGPAIPTQRAMDVEQVYTSRQGAPKSRERVLIWGPIATIDERYISVETQIPWPVDPDSDPNIVPFLWSYYVKHNITATVEPDGVHALLDGNASIRWSMAETAATFSGTLVSATGANQIKVAAGSDPKRIRLGINGETFDFLVKTWTEAESFNNVRASVSGHSLSYLLGGEFYLPESAVENTNYSLSGLAESMLPDDWSLLWTAADWLVPGGTFSYVGLTPIQAISRLASAAGAYVECDDTQKQIRVKSIWPIEPWNLSLSSAYDVQIPAVGIESLERPMGYVDQANRIYVAGGETNGVYVEATISGTDGQLVAPQVQDGLICHVDGARALAIRELAKYAKPPAVSSFSAPFGGDFPLLRVGQVVRINFVGMANDEIGIVSQNTLSISVTKSETKIRQNVVLGEGGTTNAFRRLVNINAMPLRMATVATVHIDGTVTVGFPRGGSARVRRLGTEAEGDNVWVRGQVVEALAPDLGEPQGILV